MFPPGQVSSIDLRLLYYLGLIHAADATHFSVGKAQNIKKFITKYGEAVLSEDLIDTLWAAHLGYVKDLWLDRW